MAGVVSTQMERGKTAPTTFSELPLNQPGRQIFPRRLRAECCEPVFATLFDEVEGLRFSLAASYLIVFLLQPGEKTRQRFRKITRGHGNMPDILRAQGECPQGRL